MWFDKKNNIVALAPMADMTDGPFCRVCREVAVGHPELVSGSLESKTSVKKIPDQVRNDNKKNFVIFREMVSAEAIVRENEKTLKMCEFEEVERPIVSQIFGGTPDVVTEAAKIIVERFSPDGIDINMGCPVPKITGKAKSGAALMKDHDRAVTIVKALKNANLGVPVSVKTRLGWSKDDEILEFAKKIEQAGADLISIHGRTRKQGYSGKANWEVIKSVTQLLSIPVLANGDITSQEDIEKCLEVTGADGVMIGRGALGNPWLLSGYPDNPDLQIIKKIVLRHAQLHLERYGEENGLRTFRKHLVYYFKGMAGVKKIRSELVKVSTVEELEDILSNI